MKKKTIELLKSGNFTLEYHDSQACNLYAGKHKHEDLTDDEGEPALKVFDEFDGRSDGYIPAEVEALVKALGGKVVTI